MTRLARSEPQVWKWCTPYRNSRSIQTCRSCIIHTISSISTCHSSFQKKNLSNAKLFINISVILQRWFR